MEHHSRRRNIVLIGMPGSGKSTLGVLLAKALCSPFIDTDIGIQSQTGHTLQQIIAEKGIAYFGALEESFIRSLHLTGTVIATGGSVVYSEAAMRHLRNTGKVIWLSVPLDILRKRLGNLNERGVLMKPGQTLTALFEERAPLYDFYADVAIHCDGLTHDQVLAAILEALAEQDL